MRRTSGTSLMVWCGRNAWMVLGHRHYVRIVNHRRLLYNQQW